MAVSRARLSRTSLLGGLAVAIAGFAHAACDDFASTPPNDGGAETDGTAKPFEAGPVPDAGDAGSAPPFCASLPPLVDGGARFCDDFDQDPSGGRRLVGWAQDFTDGATRGTFAPSDLSAPFGYRVEITKGAAYLTGLLMHTVADPGRRFRVSFQVRGAQPASAATFGVITLGNPPYDAFLELHPATAADRVGVSQRRIGPDGGYQSSTFTVPNSGGIQPNRWTPVVVEITAATIRVDVGGDVGQAVPFAPQVGTSPITLRLGAIVLNGVADTDFTYDNVLIEVLP